jgi:VanZ family protein
MPTKRTHKPQVRLRWIHSTRLHVVLYSMLLIATPFLMLRHFLQSAIGRLSVSTFELGGIEVPIVPVAALVPVLLLLIRFRAGLTRLRILAGAVAVLMIALAQQITDYYLHQNFYDLQQNWHYVAYALFAFMMYRDLAPRGASLPRIMLATYCAALLFSTFDEGIQRYISSRVFDVSDIAKDVWGVLIGMTLLYLGGTRAGSLLSDWRPLRHRSLRGYVTHPFSLYVLMIVLAFFLLCSSSLLSDFRHWKLNILFPVSGFAVFFGLFHVSQYRWGKYSLLTILVAAGALQSYFFIKYRHEYIIYNRYGLTVYKGIPIVFFDVLFFPDGTFRLVDKKHEFNMRDQQFLLRLQTDIIVIGKGAYGRGGRGFYKQGVNQFVYNPHTQRGTQLIILNTPEACEVFNRLKRQGKNVLFVLHNTC